MIHGPSFRLALRRLIRSKKFIFAIVLSVLPAIFGTLLLVETALDIDNYPADRTYDAFSAEASAFILAGTIPLVALLLAGGMLADDIEDRTLSYLLVRPVKRATQYRSRLAAVMLATTLLSLLQAALFAIYIGIEWFQWYQETPYLVERIYLGSGEFIDITIASGPVALRIAGSVLLAAPLLGAGLAALFGFISLVASRFHFLANLIVFLAWEVPFGAAGSVNTAGLLTLSFTARNIVDQAIPDPAQGIAPWLSVVLLLVWITIWGSFGAATMQRKDFSVTSARS